MRRGSLKVSNASSHREISVLVLQGAIPRVINPVPRQENVRTQTGGLNKMNQVYWQRRDRSQKNLLSACFQWSTQQK